MRHKTFDFLPIVFVYYVPDEHSFEQTCGNLKKFYTEDDTLKKTVTIGQPREINSFYDDTNTQMELSFQYRF